MGGVYWWRAWSLKKMLVGDFWMVIRKGEASTIIFGLALTAIGTYMVFFFDRFKNYIHACCVASNYALRLLAWCCWLVHVFMRWASFQSSRRCMVAKLLSCSINIISVFMYFHSLSIYLCVIGKAWWFGCCGSWLCVLLKLTYLCGLNNSLLYIFWPLCWWRIL